MLKFIIAIILTIIAVNAELLTAVQAMWAWGILSVVGFIVWVVFVGLAIWANK